MKLYFAGSIRGGREDVGIYIQIIEFLNSFGKVLTEHVGDPKLKSDGDDGPNDKYIHDRDMDWLLRCDYVIAEVSNPSIGVGYEIGRAIENGVKVLALYRNSAPKRISAMISGSEDVQTIYYNHLDDLKSQLNRILNP